MWWVDDWLRIDVCATKVKWSPRALFFSLFWLIVGGRPLCVDRVTGSTGDDPAKIMLNKGAVALPPPGLPVAPATACSAILNQVYGVTGGGLTRSKK